MKPMNRSITRLWSGDSFIKFIILFWVIVYCHHFSLINVNAVDSISTESCASYYQLIYEEYSYERIGDYSINSAGEIAVATRGYINIYDENGIFLYGYSLPFDAGAYAIEFSEDEIKLYLIRQNSIVLLDRKGNVISTYDVNEKGQDQAEFNKMQDNMRLQTLMIKNNTFKLNSTFTKLSKTLQNGEEIIIYHTETSCDVYEIIFYFLFSVVVIMILIYTIRRKKMLSQTTQ